MRAEDRTRLPEGGEQEPAASGGHLWLVRARGTSMRPALLDGDWLLVDVLATRPRRGEVWCCRAGGRLLAHRVDEVRVVEGRTWLRCRGDRSGRDPWTDELLGRVTCAVRGRGLTEISRNTLRRGLRWMLRAAAREQRWARPAGRG